MEKPCSEPELLPVLPLIYVAWSDGDLNAGDLASIFATIDSLDCVSDETRSALGAWLDPADPPTTGDLLRLLHTVRAKAPELDPLERTSLAQLGAQLVNGGLDPSYRRALDEIETALGVVGSEATRELMSLSSGPWDVVPEEPRFDITRLLRLLDGSYSETRDEVRALVERPAFAPEYGIDTETRRRMTLDRCQVLADRGYGASSYPTGLGGEGDLGKFIAVFETMAFALARLNSSGTILAAVKVPRTSHPQKLRRVS